MKLRDFLPRISRRIDDVLRKAHEQAEYERLLVRRLIGVKDWNAIERGDVDQDIITIDLSQANENLEVHQWGYGFVVQHIDGKAYARFSIPEGDPIPLHVVRALAIPFSRIFISNEAQPGRSLILRTMRDIRANFSISPTFARGVLKSSFAVYENLAAGASAVLASERLSGPGYLESALVSSAVPVKAELQTRMEDMWITRAAAIIFPGRSEEIRTRGAVMAAGGSFFA